MVPGASEVNLMPVFWLHAFASIFAVMNPIANVSIFAALTDGETEAGQRSIARRATMIALFIVMFFAFLGRAILSLLGISISSFQVAGGIILFIIAFNLLQGNSLHLHRPQGEKSDLLEKDDVTVVPLATPILAGPGTISTVMALGSGYISYWPGTILTVTAFITVILITLLLFRNAYEVEKRLPQTTVNLITRMMGLLLTVIAVQMAAAGVKGLFPRL
jgi:multiple antibiotic resistance protein